jgi:2-polyprenyl-3-methyl-5-hydroxy-6-metoxy-1,4-benzoquinol methylase
MNRKQRRAALKQRPSAGAMHAGPAADTAGQLFAEALRCQRQHRFEDAARAYKRLLLLKPDHAEASNNLGVVLVAQGKLSEASARFAHSLALMPQLFEQFSGVFEALLAILPPIGEAIRRASTAWPARLTVEQLFGSAGLSAIVEDPLLLCILQSVPVRRSELELLLTSLRAAVLAAAADAGRPVTESELAFHCILAKQYFINEYVFATTPDEDEQLARLTASVSEAIASGAAIAPSSLAAIAMYQPLYTLAAAASLLDRAWPPAVTAVLTQQIREPMEELQLRSNIPRLTPIEDDVSQRVRQQYEENPYPRWVRAAAGVQPIALDAHLGNKFPDVIFAPLGKTEALDILVAGCGTGMEAVNVAQGYLGARVLAVDLSLSSLCYAKLHTPPPLSPRIEYAQADILKLPSIGRSFDMIDVCGVLHHMADPLEAWRILLGLVRPGGIMHLGFYSELGRRDVVAARAFIAERGYTPSVTDIRRCRQDLLTTPLRSLSRFNDFYTTSECRDLLFHVQESRMTLPAIKAFIDAQRLKFIGFDFSEIAARDFRALFAKAGRPITDLDYWHTVETQIPDTFRSMYQFWVQKPGA